MRRGRKSALAMVLVALFMVAYPVGAVMAVEQPDVIYQVSVINALLEGVFDGAETFGHLKLYGDFGLGTLDALDGEMVANGGVFYQVGVDGLAHVIPDAVTTPFAAVTFFAPDHTRRLNQPMTGEELGDYILQVIGSKNVPAAIRVTGTFQLIRARSVHRQDPPYRRLADVVANQVEFEFANVRGTLVGFWTPGYLDGVNVTGFHFHFLSEDEVEGGHVLFFETADVLLEIDEKDALTIVVPAKDPAFRSLDLAEQREGELAAIEN